MRSLVDRWASLGGKNTFGTEELNFYKSIGIKVSDYILTNKEGQAILDRVWKGILKAEIRK